MNDIDTGERFQTVMYNLFLGYFGNFVSGDVDIDMGDKDLIEKHLMYITWAEYRMLVNHGTKRNVGDTEWIVVNKSKAVETMMKY